MNPSAHLIAYAVFCLVAVSVVGCILSRMIATHRRDMRALDEKHAQWQATIERNRQANDNAFKLIREGFNPRGKVLEIGPDYIVTKGQDGKPVTTITR